MNQQKSFFNGKQMFPLATSTNPQKRLVHLQRRQELPANSSQVLNDRSEYQLNSPVHHQLLFLSIIDSSHFTNEKKMGHLKSLVKAKQIYSLQDSGTQEPCTSKLGKFMYQQARRNFGQTSSETSKLPRFRLSRFTSVHWVRRLNSSSRLNFALILLFEWPFLKQQFGYCN